MWIAGPELMSYDPERHEPPGSAVEGASFRVTLAEHRVANAKAEGLLQEGRYPPVGPYGARNAARQVTGRLGEWAFLDWARGHGFDARPHFPYSSMDRMADVSLVNELTMMIEVKSHRERSWAAYGPRLAASQLGKIARTADVVVFVVVADGDRLASARLAGWAWAGTLGQEGRPLVSDGLYAELALPMLRSPSTLPRPEELAAQPVGSRAWFKERADRWTGLVPKCGCLPSSQEARAADPSRRKHPWGPQLLGACWACCPLPEGAPETVWTTESGRSFHTARTESEIRVRHPQTRWAHVRPLRDALPHRRACGLCLDLEMPTTSSRTPWVSHH